MAATALFVTVKVCHEVVPAADTSVIAPQTALIVTLVVRDVACVTALPAPVEYPIPPVPLARNCPTVIPAESWNAIVPRYWLSGIWLAAVPTSN